MKLIHALAIAASALFLSVKLDGQQGTLRDEVLQKNGPVRRTTISEPAPTSLRDLLQMTDLVVRGIVRESVAYLSEDGRDIWTDYSIQPTNVVFPPEPAGSLRPGALPLALIVAKRGGRLILEGHPVESIHKGLPQFETGMDGLFLLVRNGDKYQIAGSSLGAFKIQQGEVVPLTTFEHFAREHRGKVERQFIEEITTTLQQVRQRQ